MDELNINFDVDIDDFDDIDFDIFGDDNRYNLHKVTGSTASGKRKLPRQSKSK